MSKPRTKLVVPVGPWIASERCLARTFACASWPIELVAVLAIGALAELVQHHPTLVVEWRSLRVELRSHDVDAVTERDWELAHRIDVLLDVVEDEMR
jgi:4a-hydroxytetrahydrobiopterin dehydratase